MPSPHDTPVPEPTLVARHRSWLTRAAATVIDGSQPGLATVVDGQLSYQKDGTHLLQ